MKNNRLYSTCVSAVTIVRFMQHKGGWCSFSKRDIAEFLQNDPSFEFNFNGLNGSKELKLGIGSFRVQLNLVVEIEPLQYAVTDEFIRMCHKASPVFRPEIPLAVAVPATSALQ